MIKKLQIKNFRGFEDHEMEFRPLTILVGANNAGKSTIVEALRLVSIVASRFRNLPYRYPPKHLERYVRDKVVQPSLSGLDIQFSNLFHRYGHPPAELRATFESGSSITIYLDQDESCYASITDSTGARILNQSAAKRSDISVVEIMPQIGPLRIAEEVRQETYVRSAASSNLASLHFRNQLKVFKEQYQKFVDAVAETWPGVRIEELLVPRPTDKQEIYLEVRNEDFVGEVGTMGHGLQMWIQTIWFLSRVLAAATVILDEPDVYMHADMQRRLIRHVRGRFPQVIIATHSVEIMSEVESDSILVVDRKQPSSRFAASAPAVQSLVSRIGSAHNLHLARLWNTRRLILVEGKDIKYLKSLQNLFYPNSRTPFDAIPNMSLGGWGGWNYAIGSNMLLRNAVGQEIVAYCIFDRDYHTADAIEKRHKQARERGVNLVIWNKKEIENCFLVPDAIVRAIQSRAEAPWSCPDTAAVSQKLHELAGEYNDAIFDALSAEFLATDRTGGATKANQRARAVMAECRDNHGTLLDLASGKDLISSLSTWSQTEFGVSLSPHFLASSLRTSEVHPDLALLVHAIEHTRPIVP